MTETTSLRDEELMHQMAKIAMEQATEFFAVMAEEFARDPRMQFLKAPHALQAFAKAIRETNRKQYPVGGRT